MSKRNFTIFILFMATSLIISTCAVPVTSGNELSQELPPPTLTCPPIQSPASVSVPDEITSITILAGTFAYNDPGTGDWCDTSQLTLVKVSVAELVPIYGCFTNRNDITYPCGCFTNRNDITYPCSVYNALAAVDIQPSQIKFPTQPRPVLVYDLSRTENQPTCIEKSVNCGGFAIYQLKSPVPNAPSLAWRYVSSASWILNSSPAAAEGKNIDHFSTFALVELPPPQPAPLDFRGVMIVDSQFIPEEPGNSSIFSVTLLIRDAADLDLNDQTRLFRFSYPEVQLTVNGSFPQECLDPKIYLTVPEQLSCLFPIDMEVILVNEVDNVAKLLSITPATEEYEARFFATLEVH
jgi:hypothetical protein